jgi:hypothetical protein
MGVRADYHRRSHGEDLLRFFLLAVFEKSFCRFYQKGCLHGGLSYLRKGLSKNIGEEIPWGDRQRRPKESKGSLSTKEIPQR